MSIFRACSVCKRWCGDGATPPRCSRCRLQSKAPSCRHCKRNVGSRPRGLCFGCYNQPDIRRRYHSLDPQGQHCIESRERDEEPPQADGHKVPCIAAPVCRNWITVDEATLAMLTRSGMVWRICPDCRAIAEKHRGNETEWAA